MTKPGRNDPCPCGSGKKYKHCCWRAEATQAADDRSRAVPRALSWLMTVHGRAVRASIDAAFFKGLSDQENERLQHFEPTLFEGIMVNAMEWLLAEGAITVKGHERRVAELLLGRGGRLLNLSETVPALFSISAPFSKALKVTCIGGKSWMKVA